MAAPKAAVRPSQDFPGAFQVVFPHQDEEYVVDPVASEEAALLICDALTIRAAVDAERDLAHLQEQLRSMLGPPRLDLLGTQFGVDAARASFEDIVEQLDDCAMEALEEQLPPGGAGLLLAALSTGHDEAAQLLLAAAPSLAQADGVMAAAVEGALDTAAHSASVPVALLLAALPDPRAAVEALPAGLACAAAQRNGVELLQQLLQVAPSIATAVESYLTTTMWAARNGCAQALAVLVDFNPAAAVAANEYEEHALHATAMNGSVPCIEILLAAAPQLATAVDDQGMTATYVAAKYGNPAALEALLRQAPGTAATASLSFRTPLHAAAEQGNDSVVQLLLAAAPQTAQAADVLGFLPAHDAAQHGHSTVLSLLLAAGPACATARDGSGWMPAHVAALNGHPPALSVLLAAAPAAAGARTFRGYLPIDVAVELILDAGKQPDTVRTLLPHDDARAVLRALKSGGPQLAPLFADFVRARLPLSPTLWALLPAQCPGLGRVLPPALEHSVEQAASLVRHMPPADRLRLRTAALCLASTQKRVQCHLPQPVLWTVLSMFDA